MKTVNPVEHTEIVRRYLIEGTNLDAVGGMGSEAPIDYRSLWTLKGAAGGYLVPMAWSSGIVAAEKYFSAIIDAGAAVVRTDNGNPMGALMIDDTGGSANNTPENTDAGTEVDPAFRLTLLGGFTYKSEPIAIPISLIEDAADGFEDMLLRQIGRRMGRAQNPDFTAGDGSGKPQGIVPASTVGVTAASATAIAYAELVDLEHSVDPAYREAPSSCFMGSDNTLKALEKLTDTASRPVVTYYAVDPRTGKPAAAQVRRHRFIVNPAMDDPASGARSLLFGDFSQYLIRRTPVSILRMTERFADRLQVGIMAFQRADGVLMDAGTHPVKCLVHP